tara:strand:- start:1227 stop:1820 length:594 start_codon:yes stop_codon:yes gene_type:complete
MDASGAGTAQLLNRGNTNLGTDGNPLNWVEVFKGFGEFRDGISQLRLKQTDNPAITTGDIIGNIAVNSGNTNLLDITMDTSTFPTNTQPAVDAVINPQANTPGDGTLSAATDGDRYLLTEDVAGGAGWLGSAAKKHDIIQYAQGSNTWSIAFDASVNGSTVQHTTNITTNDRLKYNGTEWVNAFEGTYNSGFWRIYL